MQLVTNSSPRDGRWWKVKGKKGRGEKREKGLRRGDKKEREETEGREGAVMGGGERGREGEEEKGKGGKIRLIGLDRGGRGEGQVRPCACGRSARLMAGF